MDLYAAFATFFFGAAILALFAITCVACWTWYHRPPRLGGTRPPPSVRRAWAESEALGPPAFP